MASVPAYDGTPIVDAHIHDVISHDEIQTEGTAQARYMVDSAIRLIAQSSISWCTQLHSFPGRLETYLTSIAIALLSPHTKAK
jgi:hypothetical protein